MSLFLYRGATTIAAPLIKRYLQKRLRKGKEDPARFQERLGQAVLPRPNGPLLWIHGASVGESLSILPLLDRIQHDYPDLNILVTTGTVTSANLMAKRLPKRVIHQYMPVDRLPFVRAFLDHWQPDFAIWVESELWPNMVMECGKRGTPMALLNARMSDKSLKNWQRFPKTAQQLLDQFNVCLAQTEEDAKRYLRLGARWVTCPGNLKYAAPPLPFDPAEYDRLKTRINDRPLWMAASTHPGEESVLAQVHQTLQKDTPDFLCFIAPRHPERGDDIRMEIENLGLCVAQRSRGELPDGTTDIYLCDTMGEMGLFYELSPLVFMGKSLTPLGGQNPLEPARQNCAVLSGPYMDNFAEIMAQFAKTDALLTVKDPTDLAIQIGTLNQQPQKRLDLAQRAQEVASGQQAVLDNVMETLTPFLDQITEET